MPCYRTLVVRDPAGRPHFPRGLSFCRLHFPRGLSFCRPNGFASTARGSVLLSPTVAPFQEVCPFVAHPQRIRLHCQEVCPFVAYTTDSPPLPGGLSFCRLWLALDESAGFPCGDGTGIGSGCVRLPGVVSGLGRVPCWKMRTGVVARAAVAVFLTSLLVRQDLEPCGGDGEEGEGGSEEEAGGEEEPAPAPPEVAVGGHLEENIGEVG